MVTIGKAGFFACFLCAAASSPGCKAKNGDDLPLRTSIEEESLAKPLQTIADEDLPEGYQELLGPWTGDFDGMVERRVIRALVVFSKMFYFLDGVEQMGITYEALELFEEAINEELRAKPSKVQVVVIPVSRDQLIPALVEGWGDIAAANLTITAERLKLVDFSDPFLTRVSEVVVTGPGAPAINSLDDLAGKEIVVRASSSYYESLRLLNSLFRVRRRAPVKVTLTEEYLEDEDLLEMVNAELIPMVVVDSHKAEFWGQIFDGVRLHSDVAVASGGEIAWAFRKNSPKLSEVVNAFVRKTKLENLTGNVPFKRYLRSTKWVESSLSDEEIERFQETVAFFKKFAGQYGFDWLMLAALGYQESRLDQSLRSGGGAVGVMQILPSTAADRNVDVPNIEDLENNIHAGTKYLRFLRDRYFSSEDIDELNRNLFTFASYNLGPARVVDLRRRAAELRLDPNVWFQNVEVVAAREIGREAVQYISNITKYYVAYRRVLKKGGLPSS
jgi:membrane-bound lytic murein transglycosylase MltF